MLLKPRFSIYRKILKLLAANRFALLGPIESAPHGEKADVLKMLSVDDISNLVTLTYIHYEQYTMKNIHYE